jgi:hypothetical protein
MSAKQLLVISLFVLLMAALIGVVIAMNTSPAMSPTYTTPVECVVIAVRDAVFCR